MIHINALYIHILAGMVVEEIHKEGSVLSHTVFVVNELPLVYRLIKSQLV